MSAAKKSGFQLLDVQPTGDSSDEEGPAVVNNKANNQKGTTATPSKSSSNTTTPEPSSAKKKRSKKSSNSKNSDPVTATATAVAAASAATTTSSSGGMLSSASETEPSTVPPSDTDSVVNQPISSTPVNNTATPTPSKPSPLVQQQQQQQQPTPRRTSLSNGKRQQPEQEKKQVVQQQQKQEPTEQKSASASSSRLRNATERTIWTLIMVFGFLGLVLMGHVYVIILVFICQALVFKELTNLFSTNHTTTTTNTTNTNNISTETISASRQIRRRERDRSARALSWYFFAITNYFLYGETIAYYFKHIVLIDSYILPFAQHHRMISFMLYIIGFVGFVGSLKRSQLRRQFALFCWIHMSLLLIVLSSHFMVNNLLEGLIWFWLPASLVVVNDITAYIFGMLFGRTPLTELSPKKTVEGFVGALFSTIIFGFIWATIFMKFDYMICPVQDLGKTAFSDFTCKPNPVFEWRELVLPEVVSTTLSNAIGSSITHLPWAPFQLHSVVMAIFASVVAPFGGFFASGFKRAFNIKDFGDSIPGHGGMTDRMDCQFIMGLFSYVYYSSLIRSNHVTVGSVLQTVVTGLDPAEQVELFLDLHKYLNNQGIKH